MENRSNELIDVVNIEEVVAVDEVLFYTYYGTLNLLLSTSGSPKNLKKFRYKSVGESALWGNTLEVMDNHRTLLFYALLDEIRISLNWYKEYYPKSARTTDNGSSFRFAVSLCLIGYIGTKVLKNRFFDFLTEFGPGGDALRSLIFKSSEYAEIGRKEFFWNEAKDGTQPAPLEDKDELRDMAEYMHGIVKLFETSTFVGEYNDFLLEATSFLLIIDETNVLDRFFSLKESVFQSVVDHGQPNAEPKQNAIFFNRAPAWVSLSGEGSFFSFLFSELVDAKTKEYILLIEYLKIYLFSDKGSKSMIKDASFDYIIKLMMDRNTQEKKGFTKDFKKLSEILLSGGTRAEQRTFFSLSHNRKTFTSSEIDIAHIVEQESADISMQFKQISDRGRITENQSHELIKLFFVNVFEKVELFLTEDGSLVYADFTSEEIKEMSLDLAAIIQSRIPSIIKRGGVVSHGSA